MTPVVVFDVDDTLYLERDYVRSGFDAVGLWLLQERQWEGLSDQLWREFETGSRGNIFDVVFGRLMSGSSDLKRLVDTAVDVYRTHSPTICLANDAAEQLPRLSTVAGLAGITDGPAASQRRKIAALNLEQWLRPIVITAELGLGKSKPAPDAYTSIQGVYQAHPSQFAYVADNPTKDFVAPKALGWRTVRIRRAMGLYAAVPSGADVDVEIENLGQLAEVLG